MVNQQVSQYNINFVRFNKIQENDNNVGVIETHFYFLN